MARKILLNLLLTICFIMVFSYTVQAGVRGSRHDFSASTGISPFARIYRLPSGAVINEVCVFCHTPHNSSNNVANYQVDGKNPPLWNRVEPKGAANGYKLYSSSTFTVIISTAPTGLSLMCLSCHDGVTSIAVGDPASQTNVLLNTPEPGTGRVTLTNPTAYHQIGNVYDGTPLVGWRSNIGNIVPKNNPNTLVDLSNDHPVSFAWVDNLPGIHPDAPRVPALKINFGSTRRMECSTCHDVHDNTYPPFLVMSNNGSQMCLACHNK